jgi:hypothetical protein
MQIILKFLPLLESCSDINIRLIEIDNEGGPEFLKTLKKLPENFKMLFALIQLYILPAIETKYIWAEKI